MDAVLKAKWIAALRSGEYAQCRYELHDDEGHHCCLGVLAVLVQISAKIDERITYPQLDSIIGGERSVDACISKNDDDALTLPEIANWLETQDF